jgi:hypothetical protein
MRDVLNQLPYDHRVEKDVGTVDPLLVRHAPAGAKPSRAVRNRSAR